VSQLEVVEQNGKLLTDSREVAEMIGKEHSHLLRDIRNYIDVLRKSKIGFTDFFIESFYNDTQGKPRPHFFMSKKGCDMVANKLTGEKGVLFTATYVTQFEQMEQKLKQPEISGLSPQLQYLIHLEHKQTEFEKKLDRTETKVTQLTEGLTSVPDHTKVVERVNEYARYTRQGHDAIYNGIYKILKARHGIDVKVRVENERRKLNADYYAKKGKLYAESTLKQKVNGIDVMVRMGSLEKFNTILVGLLAKARGFEVAE
jgi:Rha family phage regulatory protein